MSGWLGLMDFSNSELLDATVCACGWSKLRSPRVARKSGATSRDVVRVPYIILYEDFHKAGSKSSEGCKVFKLGVHVWGQ